MYSRLWSGSRLRARELQNYEMYEITKYFDCGYVIRDNYTLFLFFLR